MRGALLLLCGFAMGAQDAGTGSPAGLMADCECLMFSWI